MNALAGLRSSDHQRPTLKDSLLAAAFLIPSLVIFVTFFFYPLYRLFYLGLHQQNSFGTAERYVGWQQYSEVLGGQEFREGLLTSGRYVLLTVPLGLVLGVLLAVSANRRLRGIKVFQTIFASTVASSVALMVSRRRHSAGSLTRSHSTARTRCGSAT